MELTAQEMIALLILASAVVGIMMVAVAITGSRNHNYRNDRTGVSNGYGYGMRNPINKGR